MEKINSFFQNNNLDGRILDISSVLRFCKFWERLKNKVNSLEPQNRGTAEQKNRGTEEVGKRKWEVGRRKAEFGRDERGDAKEQKNRGTAEQRNRGTEEVGRPFRVREKQLHQETRWIVSCTGPLFVHPLRPRRRGIPL